MGCIHIGRPNFSDCESGDKLDLPSEEAFSSRLRLSHDSVGLACIWTHLVPDKKAVADVNA